MTRDGHDIQGLTIGIPYDFRRPTLAKVARRMVRPGGPMLVPKVFGVGWTLNLAHPGTWVLLGVGLAAALGAALFG